MIPPNFRLHVSQPDLLARLLPLVERVRSYLCKPIGRECVALPAGAHPKAVALQMGLDRVRRAGVGLGQISDRAAGLEFLNEFLGFGLGPASPGAGRKARRDRPRLRLGLRLSRHPHAFQQTLPGHHR